MPCAGSYQSQANGSGVSTEAGLWKEHVWQEHENVCHPCWGCLPMATEHPAVLLGVYQHAQLLNLPAAI